MAFLPARGSPLLVPVGGFTVSALESGVRIFSWSPHPYIDVTGYQIRYGVAGSVFSGMTALHEGILTASPYQSSDRPAAGEWRFGIVAVTADGRRTVPTYITAELASNGILVGSRVWHSGAGEPAATSRKRR